MSNHDTDYRLTAGGVQDYKEELAQLKAKRKDIAERLKEAKEQGDLSENADWAQAMDEHKYVEDRIETIENILNNVEQIEVPKNPEKVVVGSTVTLKDGGDDKTYTLVGSLESNPEEGKISDQSPVGQKLLGLEVGETFEQVNPNETVTYEIKAIE